MKTIKILIPLFFLFTLSLFAQNKGDLKRDNNYNPVTGYYDTDKDSILNANKQNPLPIVDQLGTARYGSTLMLTGDSTYIGHYWLIAALSDTVICDTIVDSYRDGNTLDSVIIVKGYPWWGTDITRIRFRDGQRAIGFKNQ